MLVWNVKVLVSDVCLVLFQPLALYPYHVLIDFSPYPVLDEALPPHSLLDEALPPHSLLDEALPLHIFY